MDKNFELFLKKMGQPFKCVSPNENICAKYSGLLSSQQIVYWREQGFCGYADGLFWMVNPDDYVDLVDLLLRDTRILSKDRYSVIARTAFGKLYLWGKESGNSLVINPVVGSIYMNEDDIDDIQNGEADFVTQIFYSSLNKDNMDLEDENDEPLFRKAFKSLGPLNSDEMYAFEPALVLGGKARLENLKKVKLQEHLTILAELEPMKVAVTPEI